tara:strand:- start:96 stop:410 length:315 start_codon:yes stop_codon:yes gene_type:complete
MAGHDIGIFGLKDSTWARIDAASASAVALSLARELLEKRGKKVTFGLSRRAWSNIELASISFAMLFALRNVYEAFAEVEEIEGVGSFFNPNPVALSGPPRFNEF